MKTNIVNRKEYSVIETKRAYIRAELATSYWNDDIPYTIEQLELDTDAVLKALDLSDREDCTLQDLIWVAEEFFENGDKFNTEILLKQVHERKYS